MAAEHFSPRIEQLLLGGRESEPRRPDGRELVAEALIGGAFLLTACTMWAALPSQTPFSIGLAVLFTLSLAVMSRIRFEIGAGYTIPTQLVFVPMLFALPARTVPLLVAAGLLLGDLPDYVTGRRHPLRAMQQLGDSWYAVGPAFLLAATGSEDPAWSDWPIYVGALAAQLSLDFVAGAARERLRRGVGLRTQLNLHGWVWLIDALLSPVGLLAAFASESNQAAFLLLLPFAAVFAVFAQEHRARVESALGLTRAYREKAELNAQLLETERSAMRAREELVAGASHEMQTPLAVLVGLLEASGRDGTTQVDRESLASMRRQAIRLRHLVRQFIDYTRLKSGRRLQIDARPCDLKPIVEQVADAQRGYASIELDLPEALPPGVVDPDSLHQILMNLVSNAIKFSPDGSPTMIAGRFDDEAVEISVIDTGTGIGEGELNEIFDEFHRGDGGGEGAGLGLYMVRELSAPQGVRIAVESRLGEGSRFTVAIPRFSEATERSEAGVTNRTLAAREGTYA
jgi:signal transduction histidine kinase